MSYAQRSTLVVNMKEIDVRYDIKKRRYWVSTDGYVYRRRADGTYVKMRPFITKDKYIEYVLTRTDGSKQHLQAQIAVLATHRGYPKNKSKTQVNHKDGKRSNNNLENLCWVTPKENIQHSFNKLGRVVWNDSKRNKNKSNR